MYAIIVLRSWHDLIAFPQIGPKPRAVLLAMGAVVLWATWPTLASWAQPAPPFLILALGSATGFALSLALAASRGHVRAFVATSPKTLALVSIGLLLFNVFFLMAMRRIGPAEANVISYLWPILLVLIMARLQRVRLARNQWLGIFAAFAGTSLAIGPAFTKDLDPVGILLAFASGLTFAIYAAIRSYGRETQDVIGPSMGVMAILSMALHLGFEASAALAPSQLIAVAAIGIAPLTLSNALWDLASRTGYISTVSSIAYLTPLVGLLLLALTGAATVTWVTAMGGFLIVVGALAASGARPQGRS